MKTASALLIWTRRAFGLVAIIMASLYIRDALADESFVSNVTKGGLWLIAVAAVLVVEIILGRRA